MMGEGSPQSSNEEGNGSEDSIQAIIWSVVLGIVIMGAAFLYLGVPTVHRSDPIQKCILQLSTMEKLMASYGNLNGIEPGDDIAPSVLVDDGYLDRLMTCPAGGRYTYSGKMPTMESGSEPYTHCDIENHDFDPWPGEEKPNGVQ